MNKPFYRKPDNYSPLMSPLLLTPTYEQKTKMSDRSEANEDENDLE